MSSCGLWLKKSLEARSIKEGRCLLHARLHAICFHLYYFTFTPPNGPTTTQVLVQVPPTI